MTKSPKKILGIVPARAGSKRLANKNKLEINGKTLVERAICEALKSSVLDTVLVSTDDYDIQQLALQNGAEAPFLRPEQLSNDSAGMVDVALHALDAYESEGRAFSHLAILQPTSPFRKAVHIDQAIKLFFEKEAASLVSICRQSHPWQWSFALGKDKRLKNCVEDFSPGQRSQDAEYMYFPNGAVFVISTKILESQKTFYTERDLIGFEMSWLESLDIDDWEDYELAQVIARALG